MVDPYTYRDKIAQPKLIILGNNDPYWATDALNIYWEGLPGPKWIHYVANAELRRGLRGIVDMLDVGLRSSYVASYYAAPIMTARRSGAGLPFGSPAGFLSQS